MEAPHNEEQLQKQIDSFISHKTFDEAYNSMKPAEREKFLKDYYLNENLDYDAELKTRVDQSLNLIKTELAKNNKPPFTQELVDGVVTLSKMTVMDTLVKKVQSVHQSLREKLKDKVIDDFKTTMIFQLAMGTLAMEYNQLLSQEIAKNCNERKIDVDEFTKQAFPQLTGDFSVFFEFDNYNGLKIFQELKDKKITQAQAEEYIKKTTEYSKMVTEGKMNPQTTMVFPNLVNHFLYNETQLENVQVLDFVMQKVKEGVKGPNEAFFRLVFEEIFYIEKGRKAIYEIFQMQMQFMDQMMNSNSTGDSQLYTPAWNTGPTPGDNQMTPDAPYDPMMLNSGLGSMNSDSMPNMEELTKAMENLDLSKFAEYFPEMENMMKEFTQNMGGPMDPSNNEKKSK